MSVFWLKFQKLCGDSHRLKMDYWDDELREKDLLVDICYIAAENSFVGKGPTAAGTRWQEATLREASINRWTRFVDNLYKKGWTAHSSKDPKYDR
jgi:hypothetical protein